MADPASPLRSLVWSGLETVGTVLIGLLSVIVIARLIGPAAFGTAAIALGLTLVLVVFISSLVHDGLVRSPDYSALQLDSAFTFSLLAGVSAVLGLALLAPPLAALLDEPELVPVLLAFLPMLLFSTLASPLIAERRRALDFRTIGRQQLFSRLLGLVAGIGLAAAGGGVWSVVCQQLTTTGLLLLTLGIKRGGLPRLRLDWRVLRPILRFSQYIAWTGLVVQLTERLFLTLVGYLYGLAAAGQWAVASRLVENVTVVLTQLVYHVALAHMATLRTAREQLAKAATASRDMLMLVALPGLVAVVAAAEPLMRLLFGPGWSDVPALIAGMLLGALCVLRRLLVQVALNIIGRSATTFAAFTAESALALGLLVLLTPFGVIGAAIARGFSFALGWLVMFASGRAQLGLPLAGELRQLIVDLVVAAAAVAGTRLLFAGATFSNDLTAMVALGATAGCFALAVLCVIRFAVARELMQQLMQALRRR